MKKILLTGCNGLLGQKIVEQIKHDKSYNLIATAKGNCRIDITATHISFKSLDISSLEECISIIQQEQPDVIINAAAVTNVDLCETEKELCWSANVTGVKNLVDAIKQQNTSYTPHFIHVSTDFIFDGENGPYNEEAQPNPLSYYAHSKLEAEKIVSASSLTWSIIRTVLVYGVTNEMSRSNIVLWAKKSLQEDKAINVVYDQFRTPTLAEDLAQGCLLIADKKAEGIYNISGNDFMSIIDLVNRVAEFWNLDKSLITPVSSKTLSQAAKRPPVTGFVLNKAIALGYKPTPFTKGLAIVDEQLKSVA